MAQRATHQTIILQNASTTNNTVGTDCGGFLAAQQLEVAETNGGTATLAIQGSFDGTNWLAVGYQQVDNTAAPARAVANISITANSRHVYQLLDPYPQIQTVLSGGATSPVITIKLYAVAN